MSDLPENAAPREAPLEKHKLHWSFILMNVLRILKSSFSWAIVAGGVTAIRGLNSGDINYLRGIIIGLGGLVVVLIVASVVKYIYTYWQLDAHEILYHTGFLKKKVTHMPFERIHSVSLKESLLNRIFKVAKVSIDSAGGAAAGDILIPAVRLKEAEELRAYLISQAGGVVAPVANAAAPAVNATAGPAPNIAAAGLEPHSVSPEGAIPTTVTPPASSAEVRWANAAYRLTVKELMLAGLSNGKTIAFLLAGFGAIWQFIETADFDEAIINQGDTLFRTLLSLGLPIILFLIVLILAICWLVSVGAYALRNYGFTIHRQGEDLEIRRGLLERNTACISVSRVQELHVTRGLVQRIFGYATIKANLATGSIAQKGGEDNVVGNGVVLHPFIPLNRVEGYIEAFLPAFAQIPKAVSPLPPLARRRSILRAGRSALIVVLATVLLRLLIFSRFWPVTTGWDFYFYTAYVLLLVLAPVLGFLSWKGRGLAMSRTFIAIRHGIFGRKFVYIPRRKIQMATCGQNPFQRRARLATIHVHTAAGGHAITVQRDADANIAAYYLEWVRGN